MIGSQLAMYNETKEAILQWRDVRADGLGMHVAASFAMGVVVMARGEG